MALYAAIMSSDKLCEYARCFRSNKVFYELHIYCYNFMLYQETARFGCDYCLIILPRD